MALIYIDHPQIDVEVYKSKCIESGINPNDKKCVFIFPGNRSHHINPTLFSLKGGSGLAKAALNIVRAGYPTLSLPTTNMENWATSEEIKKIVDGAIADLYKAAGAGYDLMLPIREKKDQEYFDGCLNYYAPDTYLEVKEYEPSFWGKTNLNPNKALANYYVSELNNLANFLSLPADARKTQVEQHPDNPFYVAYDAGTKLTTDDPWVSPIAPSQPVKPVPPVNPVNPVPPVKVPVKNPQEKKEKVSPQKIEISVATRRAYEFFYTSNITQLDSARDLLNDYTKGDSALGRFFSGHWNRHHLKEVNALVKEIDKRQIKNVADLLQKLKQIELVNPTKGSLARRIEFIQEKKFS